jgi:hypothetical protein
MIKQAMSSDAFDAMAEGSLLEELKFLVRVNFLEFELNVVFLVELATGLPVLWSPCVMYALKGKN